MWQILDTGRKPAQQNMDLDGALLADLAHATGPILHLYEWEGDSVSHGHFIQPDRFFNITASVAQGLSIARRPTGGGIVFHICDLAFSILVPATHPSCSTNTLANYAFVNNIVVSAVSQFLGRNASLDLLQQEPTPLDAACRHFCMAKPTKFDVMMEERKVGGAAQRRTRDGFLHQGTIAIAMVPESYLERVLLPSPAVIAAMQVHSAMLLGPDWQPAHLQQARAELRHLLIENLPQGHTHDT